LKQGDKLGFIKLEKIGINTEKLEIMDIGGA
jgi:hypothetical protein